MVPKRADPDVIDILVDILVGVDVVVVELFRISLRNPHGKIQLITPI